MNNKPDTNQVKYHWCKLEKKGFSKIQNYLRNKTKMNKLQMTKCYPEEIWLNEKC
jgi:hypothetical protein